MANPTLPPSGETSGESGILSGDPAANNTTTPAPPEKKKRGIVSRLVTLGILAGGAAWLFHFVHESINYETTDDAYITGHIHRISPGVGGPVLKVLVDDNEKVKAGQLLAEIDPLEFEIMKQKLQAALAQAEASESQAAAALDEAKAGALQAEAQVASAEAMVKQAEAQLDLANVNYTRNSNL